MADDENGTTATHSSADDRPQADDVFYCHTCHRRVRNVTQEFQCPHCQQGFLEKLDGESEEDDGNDFVDHAATVGPHQNIEHILPQILGQLLNNAGGQTFGGRPSGTANPSNNDPFVGFLQQLMQNLGPVVQGGQIRVEVGPGDSTNRGATFVLPGIPLHGNVGDYAWGAGGLDQIVTNLLNQFEGGAPPLTSREITDIPKIQVNADQIERKAQCTTCMDDLTLGETVRQLYCGHCFHDDCIIPWLRRHNTCPICRKVVRPTSDDRGGGDGDDDPSTTTRTADRSQIMDTIDELD